MDRSIAMLAIGLIFGGGIGFVVAASQGVTLDGHDHDAPAGHSGEVAKDTGHAHDTLLTLAQGAPTPELKITVVKDPMSGWNLRLDVQNFRFAPQSAGLAHVAGEGHAHVYVKGSKIARLYGHWMHIASLPQGRSDIAVTLNSNDHRQLAIGGVAIEAKVSVTAD